MNIWEMQNRTKTYLAGDWTGDNNAIEVIHKWNESDHYGLHFTDVHSFTTSYDSSNYCSIKKSLRQRMKISKRFVLVVGSQTNTLTKGTCFNCAFYRTFLTLPSKCILGNTIDNRSYIKFECDKAVEDNLDIVVLYNDTKVDRSKCPESVRWKGKHIPMIYLAANGNYYWDYQNIKKAING